MYEDLPRVLTVKTPGEFTDYLRGWVTAFGDAAVGSPQYVDGPDHSVALPRTRRQRQRSLGPFAPSGRPMDGVQRGPPLRRRRHRAQRGASTTTS